MRGGNQGGPSPWQQGSVPQQQQQQFHPQQQQPQQQRQYQQPQMMQQQRQQQQPGNWGANPAWGNQSGQGNNHDFDTMNFIEKNFFSPMPIANIPIIYFLVIIGQMMGGGGYGNMANNGGMNQGMRGANQGGGMNQPWSGQMGNPQGAQMRQQPQQVYKNFAYSLDLPSKLLYP